MRKLLVFLIRFVATYVVVFGLSAGVFIILANFLFQITQVYLEANVEIFPDLNFFNKRQSLIFLSTTQYEKDIKKTYPSIKDVLVIKQYPNSLYIKVTQRVPIVFMYTSTGIVYVDSDGYILPLLKYYSSLMLPQFDCQIVSGNSILLDAQLILALQILESISKSQLMRIQKLSCREEKNMEIKTDAFNILFLTSQSPQEIVSSLHFLIKQFTINASWPKSVDLRFDKKVIIP